MQTKRQSIYKENSRSQLKPPKQTHRRGKPANYRLQARAHLINIFHYPRKYMEIGATLPHRGRISIAHATPESYLRVRYNRYQVTFVGLQISTFRFAHAFLRTHVRYTFHCVCTVFPFRSCVR